MAVLIAPNGDVRIVVPPDGRRAFTLAELQGAVGGYIQAIPVSGVPIVIRTGVSQEDERVYLVLNEDGKRLALPYNAKATALLHAAGGMPDDFCVGVALLATHIEMGGDDEGEE